MKEQPTTRRDQLAGLFGYIDRQCSTSQSLRGPDEGNLASNRESLHQRFVGPLLKMQLQREGIGHPPMI